MKISDAKLQGLRCICTMPASYRKIRVFHIRYSMFAWDYAYVFIDVLCLLTPLSVKAGLFHLYGGENNESRESFKRNQQTTGQLKKFTSRTRLVNPTLSIDPFLLHVFTLSKVAE